MPLESPPGYRFDPELAPHVGSLPQLDLADLAGARRALAQAVAGLRPYRAPVPLDVRERSVPGPSGAPEVRVRVYTPLSGTGDRPAVVFMHGGGFVMGDLETDAALAAKTAATLGAVTISCGYRLAPEHPFPAAVEDCYAVVSWAVREGRSMGIDPARVAVHGISAGAGLAAGVTLMARDRRGPAIAFQLLGMPALDDRLTTPSMRAFVDTPMWSRRQAELSWSFYLGDAAGGATSPYAAPARAADLGGLPPAYVYVCEYDPLRDEGIEYAQRLVQAGVATELHLYPGTFHTSTLVTRAAVSRRMDA